MTFFKAMLLVLFMIIISMRISEAKEKKGHLRDYVEIRDLYIEAERATMVNRNYFFKDRDQRRYSLNLGLNLDITEDFFFNSLVTSMTDKNQFRFVGLDFDTGYRILHGFEVYFKHFSGHILDDTYDEGFPQDNSIGVRFRFIGD